MITPQRQSGSVSLEVLLSVAGAIVLSALALPVVCREIGLYLRRFTE